MQPKARFFLLAFGENLKTWKRFHVHAWVANFENHSNGQVIENCKTQLTTCRKSKFNLNHSRADAYSLLYKSPTIKFQDHMKSIIEYWETS